MITVVAPTEGTPRNPRFAGEIAYGAGGPCPLGAAIGASGFFHGGNKYCHNGGTTFATSYR
jgi:hypothetical protein